MKCDQRERFRAEGRRVLKSHVILQLGLFAIAFILLLTGNLACAAADALCNVNQRGLNRRVGVPLAHDVFLFQFLDAASGGALVLTTFTRQAFVS
jgi:hypothetical protein